MTKHTELVTNLDRLYELAPRFEDAKLISYDCETEGLNRFDRVIGCAFALSTEEAYYIPTLIYKDRALVNPWSVENYPEVRRFIVSVLTQSQRLITHNGSFDAKVTQTSFGINIMPFILADTQLMHHTAIDESPPHGLKPLAVKFLDPNADAPQDDLKDSVLANGGKWNKGDKDIYMGDWDKIGIYACQDVILTFGLYNRFVRELTNSPKLIELWGTEVMPLMDVTYRMNSEGIGINVPYFEQLRIDMEQKAAAIEDEVYSQVESKVKAHEIKRLVKDTKITKQSQFGKHLLALGVKLEEFNEEKHGAFLYDWYTKKNLVKRVFNLDSQDDKAFLLYDVLELPCPKVTESGKRSTTKGILDDLADKYEDSSAVLKLIRQRSSELKLLSTYVIPILEDHINGRIYPSFNQTGTTSGRYSCGGNSLNLQTLPREDHRIKAGFIPDEGYSFVAADYASLEPHIFAFISGEDKIKKIFRDNLDFYSSIAIDVLGLTGVSADPKAENYLGKVDKAKRQWIKAIALSIPYGAEAGRLSQIMHCTYPEAQEVYDKYMKAYPTLKKWMDKSNLQMKMYGYVESLVGRRKRDPVVQLLYNKYKVRNFSKKALQGFIARHGSPDPSIQDDIQLFLHCRTAINVAKNHQIQSLAASVCNAAMVEFNEKSKHLDCRIVSTIHDELVVSCKTAQTAECAAILKECMENNRVTRLIDVKMKAVPVISAVSLAEAK